MARVVWKRLAGYVATCQIKRDNRLSLLCRQLSTILEVKALPPSTNRVTARDPVMGAGGGGRQAPEWVALPAWCQP